jgi:protein O-GlcNAc transferase
MNTNNLLQSAVHYYQTGNFGEAEIIFKEILKTQPDNIFVLNSLGNILRANGQVEESKHYYLKVTELDPDFAGAYYNLGQAFTDSGQLDEAIHCYQKAVELNPKLYGAYYNLGFSFQLKGKLQEAELSYRHAIQINPSFSLPYQNLLFVMNYNPKYDNQTIFSEHLRFADRFEKPLLSSIANHHNDRTLMRRLRIGYVSPDFKRHSVAYFIEPVLSAHNREQFEVFCYSLIPTEDEVTKRLQGYADHWRNISGMSDGHAAELIRNDTIDILVDLAGYTTNNRILLFARKPAPVQISWIGYLATTGLSSMDYKLVDSYTDPPGITEQFYTEKLIRLPDSMWCYLPDKDSPQVGKLPALTAGHITFGSFNNFAKISQEVISVWSKILKAIPNSRLIMKTFSLHYRTTREYTMDMFSHKGIDAGRIVLLSWEPSPKHLESYNLVDIGLDTFTYNGGTTTCEALWMGVPVITLAGNSHASRVGISLLSNIGLAELVAETPDEYLSIAVNLANDMDRLQSLRKNLRDRMAHSNLTDSKHFTLNLEKCYRTIWENWCKSA